MDGFLSALRKYATFGGRAGREEFWSFFFVSSAIGFVLLLVDHFVIGLAGPAGLGFLSGPFFLVMSVLQVAVAVRRLHDVDRSGLWTLPCLLPGGVLPLVFFALQRGTPRPNHYGPEPGSVEERAQRS